MSQERSIPSLASTIRDVCSGHPVVLAYLFGSHARGTADAESDVDVAVLVERDVGPERRQKLRLALGSALGEALGQPERRIDVVVLQDVPVLLQRNVVRGGVPVVGEPAARRDYELSVERRYEDESPLLDREAELTIERILARAG